MQENEGNDLNGNDDEKESSDAAVKETEVKDSGAVAETKTSDDEQASETKSSLRAENEETESSQSASSQDSGEEKSAKDIDNKDADADGFYDGLVETVAVDGSSYYFDFTNQITDFDYGATDENPYTKGLFSYSMGSSNKANYSGQVKYGIDFKTGNKLTFKVSGNSYIVIGGDNNSKVNLKASSTDTNGKFYEDSLSLNTTGHAEASDCKNRTGNAVVFEYTGSAGEVTLTLEQGTGNDGYIAHVCIIPIKTSDVGETATSWDFSDESFTGTSPYNGLRFSNAQKNQTYLLAKANSTVTVPIKDTSKPGKVIVKACYQYSFKFENEKNTIGTANGEGSTSNPGTFEYYYEAGTEKVVINVLGQSYFNSIKVDTDNLTIADVVCCEL